MGETTRIENKLKLTPELDIEKEVIAFLNYKEGGYIYICVDKDGNTVGVDDIDDCMLSPCLFCDTNINLCVPLMIK